MKAEKIVIAYFSGTGGTELAAAELESQLLQRGMDVQKLSIGRRYQDSSREYLDGLQARPAQLVLMFPVYAFDACKPAYDFVKLLPEGSRMPVAVVSVSGGGEVFPNTACRYRIIRQLEKKNYAVYYEDMLVMPSNCLKQMPDELAMLVLNAIPRKIAAVAAAVHAVADGKAVRRRKGFPWLSWLPSFFGYAERFGATRIRKHISVSTQCNNCGWCVRNCPQQNIDVCNSCGALRFGKNCAICLKCIYGCPQKAIRLKMNGFGIFEEYDLQGLQRRVQGKPLQSAAVLCRGWQRRALKKYLLS